MGKIESKLTTVKTMELELDRARTFMKILNMCREDHKVIELLKGECPSSCECMRMHAFVCACVRCMSSSSNLKMLSLAENNLKNSLYYMSRLIQAFVVTQRPNVQDEFEIHQSSVGEICWKEGIIRHETDLVWSTECTGVNLDDCIGVVRAMRKSKDMSSAIPAGVSDEQAARCVFLSVKALAGSKKCITVGDPASYQRRSMCLFVCRLLSSALSC